MSGITYKITSLQNVPFAGSCKLVDNQLTNSANQVITFPSETATLATAADISGLADTYLTQTDASSTYLTQTNASTTYTTQTDFNALQTKMNNLLDYLESWANAGNLGMSDIKATVNGSE